MLTHNLTLFIGVGLNLRLDNKMENRLLNRGMTIGQYFIKVVNKNKL